MVGSESMLLHVGTTMLWYGISLCTLLAGPTMTCNSPEVAMAAKEVGTVGEGAMAERAGAEAEAEDLRMRTRLM